MGLADITWEAGVGISALLGWDYIQADLHSLESDYQTEADCTVALQTEVNCIALGFN